MNDNHGKPKIKPATAKNKAIFEAGTTALVQVKDKDNKVIGYKYPGPRITVPDDSYTVKQLMEKFVTQQELPVIPQDPYYEQPPGE